MRSRSKVVAPSGRALPRSSSAEPRARSSPLAAEVLPRGQDSREQRADNARTRPRAGQGRTGRTERTGRPLAFLLGAGLTLPWGRAGCTCSEPADEEPSGAASQLETSEAAPSAAVPVQHQSRISILDLAPRCDLHHGGLVLDLGS